MRFLVAAIQMASTPSIPTNLDESARLIAEAAHKGARLVALPENFALMGRSDTDKVEKREKPGSGPIQDFLQDSAKKHRLWLVGGSVPLESSVPDKVRASSLLYNPQGECVARYDKIHLFNLELGSERYLEAKTIEPGNEVVAVSTELGKMGLSICYDLRFPELFRAMGLVDMILLPSAFTAATGRAHWEVLVRARAIENQCYVIAPAQGGFHANGRETHGHSMVVDPWGVVLASLPRGPGVVLAEIDPERIATVRRQLPAQSHRTIAKVL